MCGIAGLLAPQADAVPEWETVARMCARMAHRGPDTQRVVVDGPLALGHRRLSIIDLRPEAAQPMWNEDRSVMLVVNGEVYNFVELRTELLTRGHLFQSNSDSEVILHLYEELGEGCLDRLRGMYALALWDARRRRLLLARDRVGKKPLYYHLGPAGLLFASEVQALLASGLVACDPDLEAIDEFLALQYVPAPRSAFKGVFKLAAGERIVVGPGDTPRPERYFAPRFDGVDGRPLDELAGDLRERIEEAVRLRMVADVPVGAFLSGGIDSSTIVALMARHSARPIKTFAIGFPDKDTSEFRFARLVARLYGTDHEELVVDPQMVSVLPELVEHYGEPFADCSAVPTWYLSRLTRQSVTVALSGDGGDEAFAGYHEYRAASLARGIRALPAPMPQAFSFGLRHLPGAPLKPVRDFGRALLRSEAERHLGVMAHFSHEERMAMYGPEMRRLFERDRLAERFNAIVERSSGPEGVARLIDLDMQTYLPDDILVKVDIASMAHSLEVRCPLLDREVLAFAATLPSRYKLHGLSTKVALRRAVADLLPREILNREKRGFGMPVDRWMREDLAPLARDLLLDRTARSRGLVEPAAVERVIAGHQRGEPRGWQLWTLLVLEQWFRTFVDRSIAPAALPLAQSIS
jgi:asparagine synthase (glutamine-hydrolysing)